jgi:hypothetical protein
MESATSASRARRRMGWRSPALLTGSVPPGMVAAHAVLAAGELLAPLGVVLVARAVAAALVAENPSAALARRLGGKARRTTTRRRLSAPAQSGLRVSLGVLLICRCVRARTAREARMRDDFRGRSASSGRQRQSGHHSPPRHDTDLPSAAGSNIPSNVLLGIGTMHFVETLVTSTGRGRGR